MPRLPYGRRVQRRGNLCRQRGELRLWYHRATMGRRGHCRQTVALPDRGHPPVAVRIGAHYQEFGRAEGAGVSRHLNLVAPGDVWRAKLTRPFPRRTR